MLGIFQRILFSLCILFCLCVLGIVHSEYWWHTRGNIQENTFGHVILFKNEDVKEQRKVKFSDDMCHILPMNSKDDFILYSSNLCKRGGVSRYSDYGERHASDYSMHVVLERVVDEQEKYYGWKAYIKYYKTKAILSCIDFIVILSSIVAAYFGYIFSRWIAFGKI